MLAKVCSRGRSATGLLRYLTSDRKENHQPIGDIDSRRLNAPSSVRPEIERPICHFALSLPDGDRNMVSAEKWRLIAVDFLDRMGLGGNEYAGVIHRETGHEHLHLVVNRVSWTGDVWKGQFEAKRAIAAAKEVESIHGLTVEPHTPTGRSPLSQSEIEKALRTSVQPNRVTIQNLIDAACAGRPTITEFIERLEHAGVQIIPNVSLTTGRVSGLAFGYNDGVFKGSQLGKNYGWNQLILRTDYEQSRDSKALQKRATGRAGSQGASAAPRGSNGSGTRGTGKIDAQDYRHLERVDDAHRQREQAQQRERKAIGAEARQDFRGNDPDSQLMGANSRTSTASASRPNSQVVRNRGPLRGSRGRISRLAQSLLARLEPGDQSATTGDNRYGSSRTPDHNLLEGLPNPRSAAVNARERSGCH